MLLGFQKKLMAYSESILFIGKQLQYSLGSYLPALPPPGFTSGSVRSGLGGSFSATMQVFRATAQST